MTTQRPNGGEQQLNDKTLEQIAQRVAAYKKSKENSQSNVDEIESHIGALSEVFHVKKSEVESIASDVFIRESQQNSFKDKFYDGLIKYGKQLTIVIIAVVIVTLLVMGRSTVSQSTNQQAMAMLGTSSSPNFSKYILAAKVGNVLGMITPIKHEVTMYYQIEGKYPQSLKDLGINDKTEITEFESIDDVILSNDGGIVIKLAESIGDNLILGLFPRSAMNGTIFEWKCKTNFKVSFPGGIDICKKGNLEQYSKEFK